MTIGIDAGHGGRDPGAIGPTGLYEKDITLTIAQKLDGMLRLAGLETYITRQNDITMELVTRTALFNNMKCDLAVSVHINSATSREANYIATFIQGIGGQAEQLAKKVQSQLVQATGWPDGGVRVKNLHMTRETRMPAILVECGFISNPGQETQLADPAMHMNLARAIAAGVMDYLGVKQKGDEIVTVDEALQVLVDKGVINGPDYWKNATECVKYLDVLLINAAIKLQGGK